MKSGKFIFLALLIILSGAYFPNAVSAHTDPEKAGWLGCNAISRVLDRMFEGADDLEKAQEREAEVHVALVDKKDVDCAVQAARAHGETLEDIKIDVKSEEAHARVREIIEFQAETAKYRGHIKEDNIDTKIELQTTLTDEEKQDMNRALSELRDAAAELEIRTDFEKKEAVNDLIAAGTDPNVVEVAVRDLESQFGLDKREIKADVIEAESRSFVKHELRFTVYSELTKQEVIDTIMEEFSVSSTTIDELFETGDTPDELEEELKIEAHAEDGLTEIEVKLEYFSGSTAVEEIKSSIGKRSQLSAEEISDVLKYRAEGEEEEEKEVEAEIIGNRTFIEIEHEFISSSTDRDSIIADIMATFQLAEAEADSLLSIEDEDGEIEDERLRIEAEIEDDNAGLISEIEVELRFSIPETSRQAILDAIVARTQLTAEEISASLEFEEDDDRDEIECTADEECDSDEMCVAGECEDLPECASDTDCSAEEGEVCILGECRDGPECAADTDCEEGDVCIEGECEDAPECVSDSDCEEGSYCDIEDRKCETAGCFANTDCEEGDICVNNECVDIPECTSNTDCNSGFECIENRCEEIKEIDQETECTSNTDCDSGKACMENKCESVECLEDSECDSDETCVDYVCVSS